MNVQQLLHGRRMCSSITGQQVQLRVLCSSCLIQPAPGVLQASTDRSCYQNAAMPACLAEIGLLGWVNHVRKAGQSFPSSLSKAPCLIRSIKRIHAQRAGRLFIIIRHCSLDRRSLDALNHSHSSRISKFQKSQQQVDQNGWFSNASKQATTGWQKKTDGYSQRAYQTIYTICCLFEFLVRKYSATLTLPHETMFKTRLTDSGKLATGLLIFCLEPDFALGCMA